MIVVIQCAGRKKPNAGHLRKASGEQVMFVANPNLIPPTEGVTFAHPDDEAVPGISWRSQLAEYNKTPDVNPLNLLPAWQLYGNTVYRRLVEKFGLEKVYILSAGWGLLSANFLTPNYDITFSASAEQAKRRKKKDPNFDLCMLPANTTDKIVFLGGKDYISLFCDLTSQIQSEKYLFYSSAIAPDKHDFISKKFETKTRTNWHYECANALINEKISV